MFTYEGEEAFIKMIFQDDQLILPGGDNFYVGVCNQTPAKTDTLLDITTEPSSAGGYARIAIPRSAVGMPTIGLVGSEMRGLSLLKTFAAVGADFSTGFTRMFLTNAASGSSGVLFGYSGAYSSEILLLDGESKDFQFEFYP